MSGLRGLVFLLAMCLAACGGPADEGCDDMREPLDQYNLPEHWGGLRSVPITSFWSENQRVTVISKPPYKATVNGRRHLCVPQVQSALLIAKITPNPNDSSANYAFRWVLSVGAGGTRGEVKIDMLNTQQVSVAGEDLRADILCERLNPVAAYDSPTPQIGVDAACTFADGNVTSGQATYTQKFSLATGTSQTFVIPPMATGWRILGNSTVADATRPFQIGMSYITQGLGGGQLTGDQLSNKDPFVPLSGVATGFRVSNATGQLVSGLVQWGLDL